MISSSYKATGAVPIGDTNREIIIWYLKRSVNFWQRISEIALEETATCDPSDAKAWEWVPHPSLQPDRHLRDLNAECPSIQSRWTSSHKVFITADAVFGKFLFRKDGTILRSIKCLGRLSYGEFLSLLCHFSSKEEDVESSRWIMWW